MRRNTTQRMAIEQVFRQHERPLSADDVLTYGRKLVESLNRATVYRNLKILIDDGWLKRISHPCLGALYERAGKGHHHHFHCRECNRAFELPGCALKEDEAAPDGFVVEEHEVMRRLPVLRRGGQVTFSFRQCIGRLLEMMNRFLLPWAASFGLFVSTSNCPCCGQPACPVGAAGMGIVAGFLAAITGFFRRRRRFRRETDSIPAATHPEQQKTKSIAKLVLLLLLCDLAFYACAHTAQYQVESKTTGVSFYEGIINFYRGPLNHLQAVRRGECPMYPSCSEYSRQAVARFGFAKGWVMSMDRLMRCGRDETRLAPKIWVNGKVKYFDPIENNALWNSQTVNKEKSPHIY